MEEQNDGLKGLVGAVEGGKKKRNKEPKTSILVPILIVVVILGALALILAGIFGWAS